MFLFSLYSSKGSSYFCLDTINVLSFDRSFIYLSSYLLMINCLCISVTIFCFILRVTFLAPFALNFMIFLHFVIVYVYNAYVYWCYVEEKIKEMHILSDRQFPVTSLCDEMWGFKWVCAPQPTYTHFFKLRRHVSPLPPPFYALGSKWKRKRSDSDLWQKPLHRQKIKKKNNVTTRHQNLRLHNDCGPT